MKKTLLYTLIASTLFTHISCKDSVSEASALTYEQADKKAIIGHYAEIVYATYKDSLSTALKLEEAVNTFINDPSQATMNKAREAWLVARIPYGQSEAFRFYSGPIDDDQGPEGLLNAWPLDEEYIESTNHATKGIIDNVEKYPEITPDLLVSLNEQEGEENISTGYHAIEFLLWGVDSSAETAGTRSHTDFVSANNADRRSLYLKLVTHQLVSHLQYLVNQWEPEKENYRAIFTTLPEREALTNILNGIGMLSGFELARERIDVPLNTMSQEDEHSCFSDNTHNDILYNAQSVQNVFEGSYKGVTVNVESGPSVRLLFPNDEELSTAIGKSVSLSSALNAPFDQLILEQNLAGRASVQAIVNSLTAQAQALSTACDNAGLKINIEE